MNTEPTAWTLCTDSGRTYLAVDHDEGFVDVKVTHDRETMVASLDPRDACVMATELVRAAGRANGKGDPVSVYMPTGMWEALIEAAESGNGDRDGTTATWDQAKAREAVVVAKAVVRGVPSGEL